MHTNSTLYFVKAQDEPTPRGTVRFFLDSMPKKPEPGSTLYTFQVSRPAAEKLGISESEDGYVEADWDSLVDSTVMQAETVA